MWVNNDQGYCIGRFGRMGVDIHALGSVGNECLFCTHGPVTAADWELFKQKMLELYKVKVGDRYMPKRFRSNDKGN